MSEQNLKVGIAGYGVVGKRRRQYIDEHPNLITVAVCDQTFGEDGVMEDGVSFHSDYRLLLDEDLDVLFVCLTNDIAAEVTIAGLEKGLHVFCEKPPGRNLQEVSNVVACASKHPGLKLMYGFNHRYHESVVEALRIVHSGELGDVINIRGVYGKSKVITFNQPVWRTKREVAGGGVLLDQGIHMVDLMRLFAGDFTEVHSFISNSHWNYDVEDNAYALMKTDSGVVAMLHSSATHWRHRFSLEITLHRGSVNLSGILSGSKSYGAETMTVVWADPDDDMGDPKEQTTRFNNDPSWASEINEFTAAIMDGKEITSGSAQDALETMRLVYRIYCADPEWKDRYHLSDTV